MPSEGDLFETRIESPEQLEPILATFEDRFADETGERLSSGEFYECYVHGEYDGPVGVAWATYYETYLALEMSGRAGELSQVVPPTLAVC